jgi:hypothetical protein
VSRRLPLISVAVFVVLCMVGVAILAVAAGGSAVAYEVNGRRTSQQAFDRQLEDIAGSAAGKAQSKSAGSINSTVAAQVMESNIVLDLLRDEADARGVTVSAADRAAAQQQTESLAGAPSNYLALLRDIYAHLSALRFTTDAEVSSFLTRATRTADIYVNPRYGRWSVRDGVCAPTGCASSSGSSSSGDSSGSGSSG